MVSLVMKSYKSLWSMRICFPIYYHSMLFLEYKNHPAALIKLCILKLGLYSFYLLEGICDCSENQSLKYLPGVGQVEISGGQPPSS